MANDDEVNSAARTADHFRRHAWQVQVEPNVGKHRPDLIVQRGNTRYVVEVKSLREARADRAIPLLSQAILQSARLAEALQAKPLAVLGMPHVSPATLQRIVAFCADFAPGMAVGVIANDRGAYFSGPDLDDLNEAFSPGTLKSSHYAVRSATDMFSDLNQWLLKVLLAPEVPLELLRAPRQRYQTTQELAQAAHVSAMSASRFARRLKEEGFLDVSGSSLRLVRRRELFQRWTSALSRSTPELRMAYLIPGPPKRQLMKAATALDACVGMFAAAELLHIGHVSGVPPYLYVRKLSAHLRSEPNGLVPIAPGEQPQVILKQAPAAETIFRGAVMVEGMRTTDVIQVYLDTATHPSRGQEQAAFLEEKVLNRVLGAIE